MPTHGAIIKFRGKFKFLSNFEPAEVEFEGVRYPPSEHAFQAAKSLDPAERELVRQAKTPSEAKRMGSPGGVIHIRPGWDNISYSVMFEIVRDKFFRHPELRIKLLGTGNQLLVEGNSWHDSRWGVCYCDRCDGYGMNMLGDILMRVRDMLRGQTDENSFFRC